MFEKWWFKTGKFDKLYDKIIRQRNVDVRYDDLCFFIEHLGFKGRQSGTSHNVYSMEGIPEIIDIQEKDGKAKPYQVRQVAKLITKYRLGGEDDE